ncbi:outer membrane protein assembly factor BamA [Neptunomonas phycophila]|jgi:outer membrane protein insertion porin family|uniref:outer membrane protein assembly factor BamA n=1 Tax=Neptunomonas phycophila TaxID=1572645 RepID=UPI000948A328|nr:outer membrane protein assembly factor BamA [Neptunomonas phycophila]QLE96639.1 outer membrane protein assembly factor BamA [Neptunomonas phycophila]
MNKQFGWMLGLALWSSLSQAAFTPFKVQDIKLEGVQRVEPGIVFRNFPVSTGDRVTESAISDAVSQLFKSGYFEDVDVLKDGDFLILRVKERPAVSLIRLNGNKVIKDEDLIKGLKQSGLQEGDVFKRSALDQIRLDLIRMYVSQGRYGAAIDTEVEELSGNRVALDINIKEGSVASIQHINVVGNTVFDDEELKDLFALKLPSFWSFYTKDDRYAREKLSGDLERLRSYYMDRGYINFSIDSTQVSITPDKQNVFITVNIDEGDQYTLRDVNLAGNMVVPEEELASIISMEPGEVFSRQVMTDAQKALSDRLGEAGYMFANISPVPELHEEDHSVSLKFYVDPGKQTYVRRINVKGNSRTADEVVRRELYQMEAAVVSTDSIKQSKERLERTGYFSSVNLETVPVPGTDDQVDLNLSVEEQQSGQFTASVGYSQSDGIILDFGVSQDNFFGSGKSVGFNITRSGTEKEISLNYLDPFYTVNGVSRGFDVFYRKSEFDDDDESSYSLDEFGGGVTFGYPIDDYQRLTLSLGIEQISVNTNDNAPVEEIDSFIDENGDEYLNFKTTLGWSNNHLNRGVFPTAGYSHNATLEIAIPGSELSYYRAIYQTKWYQPLQDESDWVFGLKGRLGYADSYGDKSYPFFKNFYAGGLTTIKGFESNSLGPRDSNDDAFGGNIMVVGGAELIFPMPFIESQNGWRSLFFVDGGNVFATECFSSSSSSSKCEEGVSFDELRYSAGLGISWLSPVGPLSIAISKPLNAKESDETQVFQFSLGQSF